MMSFEQISEIDTFHTIIFKDDDDALNHQSQLRHVCPRNYRFSLLFSYLACWPTNLKGFTRLVIKRQSSKNAVA